jgi:hypothetical protein
MTVHTDPLVDDYLRRLDAAASALPADRRDGLVSEIRDHLQEAHRLGNLAPGRSHPRSRHGRENRTTMSRGLCV